MSIRKSLPSDLHNIQELEKEIYGYVLSSSVENDEIHTYYILEEKMFLGYISLWHDMDKAQIESFIIKYPDKGYGQELLKFALDLLKNYVITLEVRESNAKAIHLYEKYGFKGLCKRKNYYSNGEDAIMMIREVE